MGVMVERRPKKQCDINAEKAEVRRAAFMAAAEAGRSVIDCCKAAGWVGTSSYHKARKSHPYWAAQVDSVRAGVPGTRVRAHETGLEFSRFVQKYFPDRRPHLPQQLRIVNELEDLPPRSILMVNLWPEAGKTATLEDWIGKTLAEDASHRIRVVSEAADLSKRIVGTCKRRFTDTSEYPSYIARYGPFYESGQERQGRPWSTDHLTLLNNPGTERDYNLVATSWTGATYGSRIDTLVLDDLQSQRNYNQAEEIFRRIRGTFFNRGVEMRTLIVGTRIGPGDFYERMEDAGLVTKRVVIPAADHDANPTIPAWWDRPNVVHDGGPCCTGNFRDIECPRDGRPLTPREFMELIRHQSGEETWWASYMQRPQATERSTFAKYLERCLDRDRRYGALVPV